MCHINIIHFSHRFSHFSHPETPNNLQVTSCNCNLFNTSTATKLNLPRPTEDEFMTQRQPQHQFVLCPTHVNSCCVVYKQTMPCLLQKFHSAGWQDAAAAAAADVNGDGDGVGDGAGGVNGVNAAGCPNLEVTGEHHPLSLILNLEDFHPLAAPVDQDQDNLGGDITDVQRFHTLSQARTAVLSTADEIHKQKLIIDKHLLEASKLLERLFLDFAHARATLQHQPAQRRAFFRKFEIPLQRASELCQKIGEADERICELFKVFLQRRKGMSDHLIAVEKKYTLQEFTDSGAYPISKARQDVTELSASNVRKVCEGSLRRGRELSVELVRLLDAVSNFMQPVQ